MIGELQGDFGDLHNKYLKQNISKYPKISVANIKKASKEHSNTVQNGCSPIRVGGYQMIRIRPSGEVETLSFSIWRQNSGREHPGGSARHRMQWQQPGANGGAHPGANPIRICGPDALRWCIRTPYPGVLLAWIPNNSSQFHIALVIKKLSKHQNLTHFLLELITRVLNMPIELKGDNYYSKVFKRVNYKLSNNTF